MAQSQNLIYGAKRSSFYTEEKHMEPENDSSRRGTSSSSLVHVQVPCCMVSHHLSPATDLASLGPTCPSATCHLHLPRCPVNSPRKGHPSGFGAENSGPVAGEAEGDTEKARWNGTRRGPLNHVGAPFPSKRGETRTPGLWYIWDGRQDGLFNLSCFCAVIGKDIKSLGLFHTLAAPIS